MTTDKPAGEMPDEIWVASVIGNKNKGVYYADVIDKSQLTKYVRADKPDAAAAREMLDTMPNLFGDITQKPQPELAKWYDRNFQAIKRILQRAAGV